MKEKVLNPKFIQTNVAFPSNLPHLNYVLNFSLLFKFLLNWDELEVLLFRDSIMLASPAKN